MPPFFYVRDCCGRALERKRTLIVFLAVFVLSMILGLCFIKTPAIYDYHLNLCDRFVDRVCFSTRNVFVIFLERSAGNALLLLVLLASGIHPATLVLCPAVLLWRGYTLGGSLYIFFSVYSMSGALIVFVLYLPIHLLIDAALLLSVALSFERAPRFRFCRDDAFVLLLDFLILLAIVAIICFAEMILLLVLFHPLGNLL